jgi:hypothetical protein
MNPKKTLESSLLFITNGLQITAIELQDLEKTDADNYQKVIQQYKLRLFLLQIRKQLIGYSLKNMDVYNKNRNKFNAIEESLNDRLSYTKAMDQDFLTFLGKEIPKELEESYALITEFKNSNIFKTSVDLQQKIVDFVQIEVLVGDKKNLTELCSIAPTFIALYKKHLDTLAGDSFFTGKFDTEKNKILAVKPIRFILMPDELYLTKNDPKNAYSFHNTFKKLEKRVLSGADCIKKGETIDIEKNINQELSRVDTYCITKELKEVYENNNKIIKDDFNTVFQNCGDNELLFILMALVQGENGGVPQACIAYTSNLINAQFHSKDSICIPSDRCSIAFKQHGNNVIFTCTGSLYGVNKEAELGKIAISYIIDIKNFSIHCLPGYAELYPEAIKKNCMTAMNSIIKKLQALGCSEKRYSISGYLEVTQTKYIQKKEEIDFILTQLDSPNEIFKMLKKNSILLDKIRIHINNPRILKKLFSDNAQKVFLLWLLEQFPDTIKISPSRIESDDTLRDSLLMQTSISGLHCLLLLNIYPSVRHLINHLGAYNKSLYEIFIKANIFGNISDNENTLRLRFFEQAMQISSYSTLFIETNRHAIFMLTLLATPMGQELLLKFNQQPILAKKNGLFFETFFITDAMKSSDTYKGLVVIWKSLAESEKISNQKQQKNIIQALYKTKETMGDLLELAITYPKLFPPKDMLDVLSSEKEKLDSETIFFFIDQLMLQNQLAPEDEHIRQILQPIFQERKKDLELESKSESFCDFYKTLMAEKPSLLQNA